MYKSKGQNNFLHPTKAHMGPHMQLMGENSGLICLQFIRFNTYNIQYKFDRHNANIAPQEESGQSNNFLQIFEWTVL